jgi:hypothetical protein
MEYMTRFSIVVLTVVLLLFIPVIAGAATVPPDSSITYTIALSEEGTANWHVEYRTLLASDEDLEAFDSYTKNVSSTYLPRFQDLMQRSAAQAAAATSRPMEITDFAGDAVIQTTPTGRYGVVYYSFSWKNFAKTVPDLVIGDAFAGGLYLAKDNTLVIRYPSGYSVSGAEPAPDQVRDGLIWYGQRSFGAGEPRMVFEKPGFPWLPLLLGGLLCVLILGGMYVVLSKRRAPEPVEAEDPPVTLCETELPVRDRQTPGTA